MTTIYFIRHAESDISVRDDKIRPLTVKGVADCKLVTEFLQNKNINIVLSSPYKRAVDTVSDFAEKNGFEIETIDDFRERMRESNWVRGKDFFEFIKHQWDDFNYKLSDGECLAEVQKRNIAALNNVLIKYKDKNIVIGTHGTALSTIINYYDSSYGYENFMAMVNIMPWVVRMDFDENGCAGMSKINLFEPNEKPVYDKHKVCVHELGFLKAYRFVVIFARYQNKWLYCRANVRDTFETAGGHIEQGETPIDAAKRELYEETGAVKFDITPVFDYSVHIKNAYSNGQVFLAHIKELGSIPEFEMAEVKLFDAIPDRMRFPEILPVLYDKMQWWLNLQSAKDEVWDVYDSERNLTGRHHIRANLLPKGDYHIVVHVWLQNSKGEFLITKRAPNKGFPNMWECTGGSAVAGDDSINAAIREVKEETGLDVKPENGKLMFTLQQEDCFCDVWLFHQDFDISEIRLQENETIDAKYVTKEEILQMIDRNEFIAFEYFNKLLQML